MGRTGAILCFAAAAVSVTLGVTLSARHVPGGFDWAYTVISRLASNRRNPDGAPWISGLFLLAMLLLWPVTGHLARTMRRAGRTPRLPILGLRIGLIAGATLGTEGLFALDLSPLGRKAHEVIAMAAFFGFYAGVLGLYLHRIRYSAASGWPAFLVTMPLVAVGITQIALYFDQRDLGWVNTGWRELGVPILLSFAFWQWMAVALLGMGLGYLVAVRDPEEAARGSPPAPPSGGAFSTPDREDGRNGWR
jgi:uncharacterized membrane protein